MIYPELEVPKSVPPENKMEWAKTVSELIAKAKPMNTAWQKLDVWFGIDGDRSASDYWA